MDFLYFSYGSNMLTERLRRRCPSATVVGNAEAKGYAFEYNKRSTDNSVKANIMTDPSGVLSTPGVVFRILESELDSLDRAEGKCKGYRRENNFSVRLLDSGKHIETVCYIGEDIIEGRKPYDWYLALVIAGAYEHNLSTNYIASLKLKGYWVDKDLSRKTHKDAIEVLKMVTGSTNYLKDLGLEAREEVQLAKIFEAN